MDSVPLVLLKNLPKPGRQRSSHLRKSHKVPTKKLSTKPTFSSSSPHVKKQALRQITQPLRMNQYYQLPDFNTQPVHFFQDCFHHNEFRVTEQVLGRGSYGEVRLSCEGQECVYAAKTIRLNFDRYHARFVYNVFLGEANIAQFAGDNGIGVPVHEFFFCNSGRQATMISDLFTGELDSINAELTEHDIDTVFDLTQKLHNFGILHRDLFLKNIMYKNNDDGSRTIRINDFGLSIAFGEEIPALLKSIDYLNVISSIDSSSLALYAENKAIDILGPEIYEQGRQWKHNHATDCSSEYYLYDHLPERLFEIYGPAAVDLLVWSVRCDKTHDKTILDKVATKVRNMNVEQKVLAQEFKVTRHFEDHDDDKNVSIEKQRDEPEILFNPMTKRSRKKQIRINVQSPVDLY